MLFTDWGRSRAKIKLLAKKSLETGEDIDSIPESMRQYLAMQAMETGGFGGAFFGRSGLMPYGHGGMMLGGDQAGQGKVCKVYHRWSPCAEPLAYRSLVIHHLTCRSLSVGKWTRVGQNTMDLIIFYSPDKCTMTYYINNEQAGYKIEYPFAFIKNIYLENAEGDPAKMGGGIVIELNRPPNFFMDSSPTTNGFFQCGDFTEDQQASRVLTHHLGGNPKVLSGQLAKLVSLESFLHRHNPNSFVEQLHPLSMSAPVSPTNRPSSQPNFAQPHVGMFQEQQWGIGVHPGMRGPGHKRQRSRSVPMAVDFSMLQQPMPSFYIQHPGETQAQPHSPNPSIYAPAPQAPPPMGPAGPNLRIDTQAGFGLDMRQYPMSATTAPSDYASPNYFASQGPENSPLPTASFNSQYGGAFLSPMVNPATLGVPPPVSPLSYTNHADPAIVDQSPPMSMMGRSTSADMYHGQDSSAISDDGHSLNELYSKHTINLPMHPTSPFVEPSQDMDMNQLVHFDTVDPASLSPESVHH